MKTRVTVLNLILVSCFIFSYIKLCSVCSPNVAGYKSLGPEISLNKIEFALYQENYIVISQTLP